MMTMYDQQQTYQHPYKLTLWRRAAAAVKDRHSFYLTRLSRQRTPGGSRYADIEAAIIKVTSHDPFNMDYSNSQRIFALVKTSPATFLRPLLTGLARRMQKTRCWVVVLKGLILMHGILCCHANGVSEIGRLPFDLSDFQDRSSQACDYAAFVRGYFAFLDEKSTLLAVSAGDECSGKNLVQLQMKQGLLDLLLQVRPYSDAMNVKLVREAMDCVLTEIFEVYSAICRGVARVLVGILKAGRLEAIAAVRILKKAVSQARRLSDFFDSCRRLGVINTAEFPPVEQIPAEDIHDLERIIYEGVWVNNVLVDPAEFKNNDPDEEITVSRSTPMLVNGSSCKTIITNNWVVFDEIRSSSGVETVHQDNNILPNTNALGPIRTDLPTDPFAASLNVRPQFLVGDGAIQRAGSCRVANTMTGNFTTGRMTVNI